MGIGSPSLPLRVLKYAANLSSRSIQSWWCAPPAINWLTEFFEVSQAVLPFTGLFKCQQKVLMPPRLYTSSTYWRCCSNGMLLMSLSCPSSTPDASQPYKAGYEPVTLLISDRPTSPRQQRHR